MRCRFQAGQNCTSVEVSNIPFCYLVDFVVVAVVVVVLLFFVVVVLMVVKVVMVVELMVVVLVVIGFNRVTRTTVTPTYSAFAFFTAIPRSWIPFYHV